MPYFIKKPIPIKAVQQDKSFTTKTMEGTLDGKVGDYLVTGVNGEQYPVDKEIFEKTYYEVEEQVYDDYQIQTKVDAGEEWTLSDGRAVKRVWEGIPHDGYWTYWDRDTYEELTVEELTDE